MNRSTIAVLCAGALGLAGCNANQQATVATELAKASNDYAAIKTAIGIAEGMAGVATLADPALIPAVTAVEGAITSVETLADAAVKAGTADSATLESQVTTLQAGVVQLENTSAAVIKVVPSTTVASTATTTP